MQVQGEMLSTAIRQCGSEKHSKAVRPALWYSDSTVEAGRDTATQLSKATNQLEADKRGSKADERDSEAAISTFCSVNLDCSNSKLFVASCCTAPSSWLFLSLPSEASNRLTFLSKLLTLYACSVSCAAAIRCVCNKPAPSAPSSPV